jgi:hypothetical protein
MTLVSFKNKAIRLVAYHNEDGTFTRHPDYMDYHEFFFLNNKNNCNHKHRFYRQGILKIPEEIKSDSRPMQA